MAQENKALMDPRRVFRHINKLRFPKMHIRAQEYYSTVRSVRILGEGGRICFNFEKEAAGSFF